MWNFVCEWKIFGMFFDKVKDNCFMFDIMLWSFVVMKGGGLSFGGICVKNW